MPQYKVTDITNVYWASNDGFKVGRDPMGIQNSSIATYGCLLPGLTNLTGHIRYYSLYCWLLNEYKEIVGILGKVCGDTWQSMWTYWKWGQDIAFLRKPYLEINWLTRSNRVKIIENNFWYQTWVNKICSF